MNVGGKSERIKQDFPEIVSKCWLPIKNMPILIRNIIELQNYVHEIIIVVKNQVMKEKFQELIENYQKGSPLIKELHIIIDNKKTFPDVEGPVLGLKTGLLQAKYDNLFFIPSDMPFLIASFLKIMNEQLETNKIVSIVTKNYFNPQLFLVKKKELQNLTRFKWRKVTDIYRLFPKVALLEITSIHSQLLLGINTLKEYELANSLEGIFNQVIKNEIEYKKLGIERKTDLLNEVTFDQKKSNLENLLINKSYFLGLSLMKSNKSLTNHPEKELLILESNLWKEINTILYSHCLKDLELATN